MKKENTRLLLSLILYAFLPTIYTTMRFHFLGNYPNDELSIASQIQWLNIIYEVLQEAFIAPLYFFLSGLKTSLHINTKIKTIFKVIFVIYFIIFLVIYFFSDMLILFMKHDSLLLKKTSYYIKLEAFAHILNVLFQVCFVIYILKGSYIHILKLSFLKLSIIFICDILFLHFLKIGVNGIAYSNIITNISLLIFSFKNFKKINIDILINKNTNKITFAANNEFCSYLSKIGKVGMISGLESLIRNFVFAYMILRMVNSTGSQELFWVIMTFFWSWLLFPTIQLGEIIKKDMAKNFNSDNIKNKFKSYLLWTTFFITLWILFIPFYKLFFKYIMNIKEYEMVFKFVLTSLPFYIVFAYSNIITNIFYGIGKIKYILMQSMTVNIIYYGLIYTMYYEQILNINLNNIILIFGISMFIGSILNFILLYYFLLKRRN